MRLMLEPTVPLGVVPTSIDTVGIAVTVGGIGVDDTGVGVAVGIAVSVAVGSYMPGTKGEQNMFSQ
jgi:hypothetical protein